MPGADTVVGGSGDEELSGQELETRDPLGAEKGLGKGAGSAVKDWNKEKDVR